MDARQATLVRGGNDADEIQYAIWTRPCWVSRAGHDHAQAGCHQDPGGNGLASSTGVAPAATSPGAGRRRYWLLRKTTELAPGNAPAARDPERRPYGPSGYTVMDGLATGPPMTYRQLGQYVLSRYGSPNQARVTNLHRRVAGRGGAGTQAPVVRQWPQTRTVQTAC